MEKKYPFCEISSSGLAGGSPTGAIGFENFYQNNRRKAPCFSGGDDALPPQYGTHVASDSRLGHNRRSILFAVQPPTPTPVPPTPKPTATYGGNRGDPRKNLF